MSFPIDLALIPIAIGYFFVGRFFLAKTLIATDACDGCKVCLKKCPVESIIMVNERPFWRYNCESCMRCVNHCPKRAIETSHSFTALMLFVGSAIITPLLMEGINALGLLDWFNQNYFTENLITIINALIFLFFVFFCYGILHYLMRYKFFARIIAYTSLSTYKFWRRYKAPKHIV